MIEDDNGTSDHYGWEGAVVEVAQLKRDIEKGWNHFWSQDQIIGFDEQGKRIGTGIPRILGKKEYRLFRYSPRSKALPSLKHKKPDDCSDG
jgi:hypothetical protein